MWIHKTCDNIRKHIQPSDVSILLGILFMVLFVGVRYFNDVSTNIAEGEAKITMHEIRPTARITDFAVDAHCIYVYYDTHGLVEAYDLSGNYLYSIRIHEYKNGIGRIGISDDCLIIQDRYSNFYLFNGPLQVSYYPAEMNVEIPPNCFEIGKDGLRCEYGQVSVAASEKILLDLSDAFWERIAVHIVLVLLTAILFIVFKCRAKWNN